MEGWENESKEIVEFGLRTIKAGGWLSFGPYE